MILTVVLVVALLGIATSWGIYLTVDFDDLEDDVDVELPRHVRTVDR